jgi:hypothetical protein
MHYKFKSWLMKQRYQRTNSTMSSVTFNWFYISDKRTPRAKWKIKL